MFLKSVVAVMLFTGLLGATDPIDHETKAKVETARRALAKLAAETLKNNSPCAVPLLEAKRPKISDPMAKFFGSHPEISVRYSSAHSGMQRLELGFKKF